MSLRSNIDFLKSDIEAGFIDSAIQSNGIYKPKLLTNDYSKKIKVLNVIQHELKNCDEFFFSVAFLTTNGIAVLLNALEELKTKNVKGRILVSQYLNFTQPAALRKLLDFKYIESKIMIDGNFHAKGYMFKNNDFYNLIIGSSNLTANALCSNKEWNLKISATEKSHIIKESIEEFESEFSRAKNIDLNFIDKYSNIYEFSRHNDHIYTKDENIKLEPNLMQIDALANLKKLRDANKKRALLISATGTGKTYLSAFDVKNFNAAKVLFVVHRLNIAKAAMKTYKKVFGKSKTMGLFSGIEKNTDNDFVFSTIQTISQQNNLENFSKNHFDYIIIDETHRAGAESYSKLINYFTPEFLLGMTATPERTDGFDIFKLFDHNIAYEIRLHDAMEKNMLCPFHYYGVSEVYLNNELLQEKDSFGLLDVSERVKEILKNIDKYCVDTKNIRGLIFCSTVKEAEVLSLEFNKKGHKSVNLSGINSEAERENSIRMIESDGDDKIDYIFTVDIFNEGVDIPKINLIVMLRPTQSAIIFVQQLGRGLRKTIDKEYLTVIDFIGNYSNNYLIPIALYGDNSYNKDNLRKTLANNFLPGTSTVNFDKIALENIYKSIDSANLQSKKDLENDYRLLKYKIGRIPMMMDFLDNHARDPFAYVEYSKSYLNFIIGMEDEIKNNVYHQKEELKLLEYLSSEINNGKRIEETIILKNLVTRNSFSIDGLKKIILEKYKYIPTEKTIISAVNNINLNFITEKNKGELISVSEKYNYKIVSIDNNAFFVNESLSLLLENNICKDFLMDSINYAENKFDTMFNRASGYYNGFLLYEKYTRKDVFRILNWKRNPVAQNVGGYIIDKDSANCPIFINYHKEDHISDTIKYEDYFIDHNTFAWMSKNKRKLTSPDIVKIINNDHMLIPLFVKKHNDEGKEFYYMGNLKPIGNSFKETSLKNNNGSTSSVVKANFLLNHKVEDKIYDYITGDLS